MSTTTTAAPASTGYTLVEADPTTLDVADNVRDSVVITDDPDFIASIAAHGVLQAVSAGSVRLTVDPTSASVSYRSG